MLLADVTGSFVSSKPVGDAAASTNGCGMKTSVATAGTSFLRDGTVNTAT
jgi:hypothetical protein